MKSMHILVLSDLSEESLRPFAGLGEMISETSKVTLLNVVEDVKSLPHGSPFAPLQSAPDLGAQLKKATDSLETQRQHLPAEWDAKMEVIAAESIAEGVAAYAQAHEVDLVAISTHGRTGFRHLALGSVAEAVLRHSPVPVLCFPRKQS